MIINPFPSGGSGGSSAPGREALTLFKYTGKYEVLGTGAGNQQVRFLTSGTLTMLDAVTCDIFLVGGGGGGRSGHAIAGWNAGGGGGGGYTVTANEVALAAGDYAITIGAGGSGLDSTALPSTGNGKPSKFYGGGVNLEAAGGKGAGKRKFGSSQAYMGDGGNGGSGGGAGYFNQATLPPYDTLPAQNGGTDGNDGSSSGLFSLDAGAGQGTTTRAFGDENGTLYAGGGKGGVMGRTAKKGNFPGIQPRGDNTGDGGHGGGILAVQTSTESNKIYDYQMGGRGGSGVVILRISREEE